MSKKKVVAFIGALTLSGLLCACQPFSVVSSYSALTAAPKKEMADHSFAISSKTASIYKDFYQKAVPLVLDKDENRSFSLVDAFVNLALLSKASGGVYQNSVTSCLACSQSELDTAAHEILRSLGTPYQGGSSKEMVPVGGFALNSIWAAPDIPFQDNVPLFEEIAQGYYADFFQIEPTAERINDYNREMTPKEYGELPQVQFDDPLDCAVVSTFDVFDGFSQEYADYLKSEYQSGTHKMTFQDSAGISSLKDYLAQTRSYCAEQLGTNFSGVHSAISSLDFSFFKPTGGASLSSIVGDVVAERYTPKDYGVDEKGHPIIPVCDSKIPYFNNGSKLELLDVYHEMGVSALDKKTQGALARVVQDPTQTAIFIQQDNICTLDYEGFVCKSITVTGTEATAAESIFGEDEPTYCHYEFDGDKPFVFALEEPVKVDGFSCRLPILYGTISDPQY